MKSIAWHASLFFILTGSLTAPFAGAADLSVKVANVKSADGNVRVALFDAATFPRKPLRGEIALAKQGAVTVIFKDVSPGTYAVSAFQDVNENEKLDTNAVGRPNEPYGFSRDARGMFGPPAFDAVAFSVQGASLVIEFKLN